MIFVKLYPDSLWHIQSNEPAALAPITLCGLDITQDAERSQSLTSLPLCYNCQRAATKHTSARPRAARAGHNASRNSYRRAP